MIASPTTRASYPGAGSVGPYTVPFRLQQAADLAVIVRSGGVDIPLVNDVDYTVADVGSPQSSITLDAALAVGETLTLLRQPALTQPTSLRNQGQYFPATIEDALDLMVMQIQSLQDQIDGSIGVGPSFNPAAMLLRLTPETGKVLAWQSATELGNSDLNTSAIVLPGQGRTVPSLTAYLLNNAVLNVKDYGALGDNVTDDTAAINAAIAQAVILSGTQEPIIYFPPAPGYVTTLPIVVPNNISVIMEGPIMYSGGLNVTALTIGDFTAALTTFACQYKLAVRRTTVSSWLSEASIGIKLGNLNTCFIEIVDARGFTIGVQTFGADSGGFVHNTIKLGLLANNKYGLDLNGTTLGTSNENLWLGGQFTVFGTAGKAGIARYGVRFEYTAGTYHHDNNLFVKPSFEMNFPNSTPAVAQAILCNRGTQNEFIGIRDEGNNDNIATFANDSVANRIQVGYGSGAITADTSSAPATNVLIRRQDSGITEPGATIFQSGPMHKRAAYADGAVSVNIPGVSIGVAADESINAFVNSISITKNYLEVSRGVGVFVDTRVQKTFVVSRDVEVGFGGRVYIVCYGDDGVILTSGGGGHPYATGAPNSPLTYSVGTYGGAYGTGSDAENDVLFRVGTAVKYVRVLVSNGTSALRIRSMTIRVSGQGHAAVWTGLQMQDQNPGDNLGTATPTLGSFGIGRRLWYTNVAAGGFMGIVCTTAGTAGVLNGGATTGAINNGQATLTLSSVAGVEIGQYITIAGVAGVKKIIRLVGLVATLDSNANATVAGAAVAFSAPVFKTFGPVSA